MNQLVLHITESTIQALVVDDERNGTPNVRRGPVVSRPAGVSGGSPEAWRQVVDPIREFAAGLEASPSEIVVVPSETQVYGISTRLVPGMREEETLRTRLQIDFGLDVSSAEFLWKTVARREEGGATWLDACVLRVEQFAVVWTRRLPGLLDLSRTPVRISPYPVAAARATRRFASASPPPANAALDVGQQASRLIIQQGDVPLFYTHFSFGRETLEQRMLTPVAGRDAGTERLPPEQARMILGSLDFSRLEERIREETNDTQRQLLRWVQIEVERFAREVTDELQRARDEYGLDPPVGMVYSETPATGLDALLAAVSNMPWNDLSPAPETTESGVALLNPPLYAWGLRTDAASPETDWRPLSDDLTSTPRILEAVRLLLNGLLALTAGVLLALWLHSLFLIRRTARVRSSIPAAVAPSRKESGEPAADAETLQKLSAAAAHMAGILRPERFIRDRLVRRFLLELTRFDSTDFVLDTILIDAGEPDDPGPVAAIQGRAGAADRELQQFIAFLEKLPEVSRTVLDDVTTNPDSNLQCRFSLTVELKKSLDE